MEAEDAFSMDLMGPSAEDKATWVVRGGNVRIENIDFRGAAGTVRAVDPPMRVSPRSLLKGRPEPVRAAAHPARLQSLP